MSREYKLYLRDILKAIEKIEHYVQGLDFDQFLSNDMVVDATVFNIAAIGLFAKEIPDEIKTKYPDVEWRMVTSFRGQLVPVYFALEHDFAWNIITKTLPTLKSQIAEILKIEDDTDSA